MAQTVPDTLLTGDWTRQRKNYTIAMSMIFGKQMVMCFRVGECWIFLFFFLTMVLNQSRGQNNKLPGMVLRFSESINY